MAMGSLAPYFSLYQFPTGRLWFAMREVAERAAHHGLTDIQTLAEQGVERAQATATLEAGWRRSRRTKKGTRKRAAAVDANLDRVLGGLVLHTNSFTHVFGEKGLGARASRLLASVMPEGAVAITSMTYENELAASEVILRELKGTHAKDVEKLNLTPFVERLEQLVGEFREALKEEAVREVSYDQIREAQSKGHEAMLHLVAKIIGQYLGEGPEEVSMRAELLAPIMAQNQRIADRYANRKGLGDVDPQTGEELSEEESAPPSFAGARAEAEADADAGADAKAKAKADSGA